MCHYLIVAGLSDKNDVLPIYIGDDRTDEDAFKVILLWLNSIGVCNFHISSQLTINSCISTGVAGG